MIGVTITTHNRRDVFEECIGHWLNHRPDDCKIVVVDDGSDVPVPSIPGVTVVRHDYPKGVASGKNAGIAALVDAGADHIWLSDDDVWPVTDDWWRPYVESPEPHLMVGWEHRNVVTRHESGWPPRIHDGDELHDAFTFPRGVLLYVERPVIDVVGGMDTATGCHGGEHVELSQRIHDAGLTRWPFADVKGSAELFFARDKVQNTTNSSRFSVGERRRLCAANGKRWGHKWAGWPWFPYRGGDIGHQDRQIGPMFDDIVSHVVNLYPISVHWGTPVEVHPGDYIIYDHHDVSIPEGFGFTAVGHDSTRWAIRVL